MHTAHLLAASLTAGTPHSRLYDQIGFQFNAATAPLFLLLLVVAAVSAYFVVRGSIRSRRAIDAARERLAAAEDELYAPMRGSAE